VTVRPNIDPHDEIAWGPSGGRASDVPITDKGAPNPLGDDPTDAEPLAPNRADIANHLYALFAPDFVQPHPDSWIEIAYGHPAVEGGKVNEAKNFSAFKLDEAVAFAEEKNKAGFNIYVGAALRHGDQPSTGRASGHHVLAASHAWSEYEGVGDDDRISAILKNKSLVPAIVLTTGTIPYPRRHLYFRIDNSAGPDDVRAANTALEKLLGSDNVKNPDRVMRLAGTVSYPPPKKIDRGYIAELVKLHQNRDALAYSLDELIGVAPSGQGSRGRGYNESEEKPASTVESFFKDVNALALARLSRWVSRYSAISASSIRAPDVGEPYSKPTNFCPVAPIWRRPFPAHSAACGITDSKSRAIQSTLSRMTGRKDFFLVWSPRQPRQRRLSGFVSG